MRQLLATVHLGEAIAELYLRQKRDSEILGIEIGIIGASGQKVLRCTYRADFIRANDYLRSLLSHYDPTSIWLCNILALSHVILETRSTGKVGSELVSLGVSNATIFDGRTAHDDGISAFSSRKIGSEVPERYGSASVEQHLQLITSLNLHAGRRQILDKDT